MIKRLRHVWPPGIRAQLTLWYTIVFAMLMLLFGTVFYTTLQASLASSVDTTLQLRTQQIAEGIRFKDGKVTIQDVTGELPDSHAPTTPVDSSDNSGTTPEAPGGTTTTNNPDAQTNQAGSPPPMSLLGPWCASSIQQAGLPIFLPHSATSLFLLTVLQSHFKELPGAVR